ncbi:MAG: hypothetical protein COT18_09595 [Elusimicrobia bacterium CG08_land_8_20_14_0_20_59_10]|nr:MAG: hypothetical protein COT18_09595 [Elusimicrobia bacterium CG08_land_8_20_14_0_20_59_10]
MTPQEYYSKVFGRLQNSFKDCHYVVAAGRDLLADGWDPSFLVAVEPVDQLEKFTVGKGMQVHLPVVGEQSCSVLMPFDFEVFLLGENHKLYTDKESQRYWFKQMTPVFRFVEGFFRRRGIPYLLDYTPSGAHLLWRNRIGTRAAAELESIGYLEEDLIKACLHTDEQDIKRRWGVSLPAARVFSGLGKLAEYVALLTIEAFQNNEAEGGLPVTVSDSLDRCINLDNSWAEGSPFMRSIRSPFSLHKKNHDKYHMFHQPPLVDVIGAFYDGRAAVEETDMDRIVDCMWDLEKAAAHAQRFTGIIPDADDNLMDLLREYKNSPLFSFHSEFDATEDLPRQAALERAKQDDKATDFVRSILYNPNPLALQPKNMMGFVYDLLVYADWKPKHIANVLRDLYIDPAYGWNLDFFKYPADEKANFWTRTFSSLALWKTGRL